MYMWIELPDSSVNYTQTNRLENRIGTYRKPSVIKPDDPVKYDFALFGLSVEKRFMTYN